MNEYKPTENEQKLIDIFEGVTGFAFPPEFVSLEDGCRALREVFNAGALAALDRSDVPS